MGTRHALFALASVVLLGLSPFATTALAAGAGAAGTDGVVGAGNTGFSLDVTQEDAVSVVVTDDGSAVANASVAVTPVNNTTYAGASDFLTDANGTVALPAPAENVTVDVEATDDGERVSERVTLRTEPESGEAADAFGQEVTGFVHSLLANEGVGEDTPLGRLIAEFVVANNPGAEHRPDHAGPPEDRGPAREDGTDTVDDETERRGPPEHAGPPGDGDRTQDDRESEEHDEDDSERRGPPDHAGPPGDRGPAGEDDEDGDDGSDDADESSSTG